MFGLKTIEDELKAFMQEVRDFISKAKSDETPTPAVTADPAPAVSTPDAPVTVPETAPTAQPEGTPSSTPDSTVVAQPTPDADPATTGQ